MVRRSYPRNKGYIVDTDYVSDLRVLCDNGKSLNIFPGIDKFRVLKNEMYVR